MMIINDCLLIPEAGVKLLSVPKLDRHGYSVTFGKTRIINRNGYTVIEQPMREGNYRVSMVKCPKLEDSIGYGPRNVPQECSDTAFVLWPELTWAS